MVIKNSVRTLFNVQIIKRTYALKDLFFQKKSPACIELQRNYASVCIFSSFLSLIGCRRLKFPAGHWDVGTLKRWGH